MSAALFATAASFGLALAQDRPPERPTRDFAVTYIRIGTPPAQAEMHVSWSTAENRLRLDLPDGFGWTVVDHENLGTSFVVLDAQRLVMPLPAGTEVIAGMPGGTNSTGRYTRVGNAAYAGLSCTVWRYEDGHRAAGEACITEDGVLLRAIGTHEGKTGGMEATRVAYGPQDPARFRRPEGYEVIEAPAGDGPAKR
ncbi:hypothetical protein GCM10009416_36770 [Craurococcus roseus]|uniref:DUF4412 domain-containing protein n=1 Tax=Craurococcus roseus TaxID=77585 RepID=A0ABN1FPI2_9PROT